MLRPSFYHRPDPLQVRLPDTPAGVVRVATPIAELDSFATDFANAGHRFLHGSRRKPRISIRGAVGKQDFHSPPPAAGKGGKSMDPNTVEPIGSDISGIRFTPSWNADFTVVSWSHTGFQHGRSYEIRVNGKDQGGNNLGPGIAPNPWRFTTTTDNIPPDGSVTVLGGRPTSALTTIPLEVTFTEPVRPGSVTYSITPPVKGSLTWRDDRRSAVFTHERFRPGDTYTYTVLTAMDIAGNPLLQPFSLTFTVVPTVYMYFPWFPLKF